jgi:molybdate transport system ATP-binding protein
MPGFAKALGESGATTTSVSSIRGEMQTLAPAMYGLRQVPGGEGGVLRQCLFAVALSFTAARVRMVAAARAAGATDVSVPVIDIACAFDAASSRAFTMRSDARVVAIARPSGSGQSSVLHALAGLPRPARGTRGDRRARAVRHRCPHRHTAASPPSGLRLPGRAALPAPRRARHPGVRRVAGAGFVRLRRRVDLLGLAPLLARRTAGLSGGEAQRVAIGRALLSRPQALLLDEPLSMLDPDRRDELLGWLVRVRDAVSLPMDYVSHIPDEVARVADEVHRLPAA